MTRAEGGTLVVAIDGPSGVGKSTVARLLARRLGVPYLDTGAMYRAVTLAVLERGVDPADRAAAEAVAAAVDLRLERRPGGDLEARLDGAPVEDRIRTSPVARATSTVSAHPGVRRRMVALQRQAAGRAGAVVEGRDIGTRVFPDTRYKFFLDARPEVRYRRRWEELRARGQDVTPEAVREEMSGRDRRDAARDDSPLTRDETYIGVDTSDRSPEEVVERMVAAIRGEAGSPASSAAETLDRQQAGRG